MTFDPMTTLTDATAGSRLPKVSVVVPTRDRPALLRRALASIVDQTYPGDIEIVVVVDQGDQPSVDLPMKPARAIRVIRNERVAGLAGARNSGILAASGSFVAHCDDDDEWRPEKLSRQMALFAAVPSAEVVVTGVTIVYEGKRIDRLPLRSTVTFQQLLRSRVQAVHPSSIVARRDAISDIGLVDEELPGGYGEDYDWLLRAARRRPIPAVQEALVVAHWHASSYFFDRWATIADALAYLLRKFPEFEADRRGRARIFGQIAFAKAAMGDRPAARTWVGRTLRLDPRERRAYLALAVNERLISAGSVQQLAHRVGRGI
jgi:glycosyltransferase involved in cell wall biosynthesis